MSNQTVRVGVGVFVFKAGQFLMGQRRNAHGEGSWSLPGGHLEFGESLAEVASREVREETGLRIKNIHFGAVTNDLFEGEGKHYVTVWLLSNWDGGQEQVGEPDKFVELQWRDFDDLPAPLFLPWRQLLRSQFIDSIRRELADSR